MKETRILAVAALITAASLPAQGRRAQRNDTSGIEVWKQLSQRFDTNSDATITRQEFGRSDQAFNNLDQNSDGKLTAIDFPESKSGGGRASAGERIARQIVGNADKNEDDQVSKAEWSQLINTVSTGSDAPISDSVLIELAPVRTRRSSVSERRKKRQLDSIKRALDQNDDDTINTTELHVAFTLLDKNQDTTVDASELGISSGNRRGQRRNRRAAGVLPKVGSVAPDFSLPYVDAKPDSKAVTLSSFKDDRPVALIFGSYT